MHHSKLYLGSKITQVLIRSLALARRQAQKYPWETFVAVIHDRLEDPSARQMIESTSSLRRTDGMDLATWVRTLIMCRTLLLKSGVQYPNETWYSYMVGQLTLKERGLDIALPKDDGNQEPQP